ncbi:hypothetical protein ACI5JL_004474 [Escherichia coli]
MNYAGHEKLRAEVAEVANAMCDLRTTMNEMEQRYSFNADTLPERLVRQTLFRANRLLMEAYTGGNKEQVPAKRQNRGSRNSTDDGG